MDTKMNVDIEYEKHKKSSFLFNFNTCNNLKSPRNINNLIIKKNIKNKHKKYKYEDFIKDILYHKFLVLQTSDFDSDLYSIFIDDLSELKYFKIIHDDKFYKLFNIMLNNLPSSIETLYLINSEFDSPLTYYKYKLKESDNFNNFDNFNNNLKHLIIRAKFCTKCNLPSLRLNKIDKLKGINNKQFICYFPSSLYSFDLQNWTIYGFIDIISNLPNSLKNIKVNEFFIFIPYNLLYFETKSKIFVGSKNKLKMFNNRLYADNELPIMSHYCITKKNKIKPIFEVYESSYFSFKFYAKIHYLYLNKLFLNKNTYYVNFKDKISFER